MSATEHNPQFQTLPGFLKPYFWDCDWDVLYPLMFTTYTPLRSICNWAHPLSSPARSDARPAIHALQARLNTRPISSRTRRSPMRFQRHLQPLHCLTARVVKPETTSTSRTKTIYSSHGADRSFIPQKTACFRPLKGEICSIQAFYTPLSAIIGSHLRSYDHLRALTTGCPKPHTHLPPTLRG